MGRRVGLGLLMACVIGIPSCGGRLPKKVVWVRQFGTAGGAGVQAASVDKTGVYTAGAVSGALPGQTSAGAGDAFVRKYDHSGVEIWTRQFGRGGADLATGCCVDAQGVYVVGYTSPGSGPWKGEEEAFVRRYGADGTLHWVRELRHMRSRWHPGTAVCSDGRCIYVAGGVARLVPGQVPLCDAFIRKYDAGGNEVWVREFGGPYSDEVTGICAASGGIYVAGCTAGGLPGQRNGGYEDAFVARFDPAGRCVWLRQFGGPESDLAYAVCADATGVYVVGDIGSTPPESIQGRRPLQAFLAKYSPTGRALWTRQFATECGERSTRVAAGRGGVFVAGSTPRGPTRWRKTRQWDVCVRRYTAKGAAEDTVAFGDGRAAGAQAIAIGDGAFYVGRYAHGSFPGYTNAGATDAFVAKLAVL